MYRTTNTIPTFSAQKLREQMPVSHRIAYFDHAAVSPLPEPTRQAIRWWLDSATETGDLHWLEWAKHVETCRNLAAELVQCKTEEIALVPNTTFGINIVANGFPWKPGDNCVVPDNEFPSNLLPWTVLDSRGVEVRKVQSIPESIGNAGITIERILEQVDSKTKIVAVSWIHYGNGYRIDLERLSHEVHRRGALLLVDAIQGLGAFPLSVQNSSIDFLAADGHKWMLGPEGAGILYIRKDLVERLQPFMLGWGSVKQAHLFDPQKLDLKESASRFEGGAANMCGLIGLSASLKLLLDFGAHDPHSGFADSILEHCNILVEEIQSIGGVPYRSSGRDSQSGIVSFDLPKVDLMETRKKLLEKNIVVSVRQNRMRTALHGYNNRQDISNLIDALRELLPN